VATLQFVDVVDMASFERIPPCADPRFDHRSCDYWEDAERGSKSARTSWLTAARTAVAPRPSLEANPFAPASRPDPADNPFLRPPAPSGPPVFPGDDVVDEPDFNPFVPQQQRERPLRDGVPRKLALLDRGRGVFGSYAKLAIIDDVAVAYAQFGPLSAYPRAIRLRDLYPQLPQAPLPAVITCIATTADARRGGHAVALVAEVCRDLAARGFAAVEAYPDLTRPEDETSAGRPGFWLACGFGTAVDDDRFPVMRRELD